MLVRFLLVACSLYLVACASSEPSASNASGRPDEQGGGRDIGIIPAEPDARADIVDVLDGRDSSAPEDSSEPALDGAEVDADSGVPDVSGDGSRLDTQDDACEGSDCGTGGDECCVQDCSSGPVCVSRPGACADVCALDVLRLGRDCTGCGAGDASGVCVDDRNYACTELEHDQCLAIPCGGANYFCTQIGGEWAWRDSPACGQSDSCAEPGTCSAGECVGGTPSLCGPSLCPADRCEAITFLDYSGTCDTACDGEGGCSACECTPATRSCALPEANECCVAQCDPVLGCSSTAGSCAAGVDVCTDPNRLQLASQCTGCGAAGASGVCSAGAVEVCDSASSGLCRQVTCGGQAYTCADLGGVWQWRRSSACDDGKVCTHTDTCAGAGSCVGIDIVCGDDQCVDQECNGTPACTRTVRSGLACDDGNACTTSETCQVSGECGGGASSSVCGDTLCTCGETNASCASDCPILLPANACANGTQGRSRCSGARVIGRQDARDGWTSGEQNTCSGARDDFSGECGGVFDVGDEHMYAIYLQSGERVNAELFVSNSRRCSDVRGERVELGARLKFRFNPDRTAAGATSCPNFVSCSAGPNYGQTFANIRSYTASEDGWLFIVMDGGSTAFNEDRGYYTLNATLSRCETADCGCP